MDAEPRSDTGPIIVYGLRDPRDGEIKYVGQTYNPKMRLYAHLCNARKPPDGRRSLKDDWIVSLLDNNLSPQFVELEIATVGNCVSIEAKWIDAARKNGHVLNKLPATAPSERAFPKTSIPSHIAIQIAAKAGVCPETVRRAYQGLQCKGASFRRVVAALKAAGLLCALLLALGCAGNGWVASPAGTGGQPASTTQETPARDSGATAGTGGQTSQATTTALPGTGGKVAPIVGTGGQIGTGGASTATGAGGVRQDAGTPAGPEVGADAGTETDVESIRDVAIEAANIGQIRIDADIYSCSGCFRCPPPTCLDVGVEGKSCAEWLSKDTGFMRNPPDGAAWIDTRVSVTCLGDYGLRLFPAHSTCNQSDKPAYVELIDAYFCPTSCRDFGCNPP